MFHLSCASLISSNIHSALRLLKCLQRIDHLTGIHNHQLLTDHSTTLCLYPKSLTDFCRLFCSTLLHLFSVFLATQSFHHLFILFPEKSSAIFFPFIFFHPSAWIHVSIPIGIDLKHTYAQRWHLLLFCHILLLLLYVPLVTPSLIYANFFFPFYLPVSCVLTGFPVRVCWVICNRLVGARERKDGEVDEKRRGWVKIGLFGVWSTWRSNIKYTWSIHGALSVHRNKGRGRSCRGGERRGPGHRGREGREVDGKGGRDHFVLPFRMAFMV